MSGARARIVAMPSIANDEGFSEPELELLERAGEVFNGDARTRDLAASRREIAERDEMIDSLTLRLVSMQGAMEDALEALRTRESELAELRRLLPESARPERVAPPQPLPPSFSAPPSLPLPPLPLPLPAEVASPLPVSFAPAPAASPLSEAAIASIALRSADVAFALEFPDETHFFAGLDATVAEGLFVATHQPLALGSDVTIELLLEDGSALGLAGRVCFLREQPDPYAERPGMGIRFEALTSAVEAVLRCVAEREFPRYVEV